MHGGYFNIVKSKLVYLKIKKNKKVQVPFANCRNCVLEVILILLDLGTRLL